MAIEITNNRYIISNNKTSPFQSWRYKSSPFYIYQSCKIIQVRNYGLRKYYEYYENLENNTSPKICLYPAKIIQVRKYGLRKYYKLFENNKVRKFVLDNLYTML